MNTSSALADGSSSSEMHSPFSQQGPRHSPEGNRAPLPVESIDLKSLVEHRHSVESTLTLELVLRRFGETSLDYLAVMDGPRLAGICSRSHTGIVLGSRFGFALFAHYPVAVALIPHPLIIRDDTPVRTMLEAAFNRSPECFFEDVALIDEKQGLLGLISARKLVQLQSRLVADQMSELHRQHDATHLQNLELFQANNAMRQSQALHRALFESHALGIALLSTDGLLCTCNKRLGELLQLEETAQPQAVIGRLNQADRKTFLNTLGAHERNPGLVPQTREYVLDVPSCGPRRFKVTTGWIAETGQVSVCFDDVTDQRMLERLMLRQEKQLLLDTMVGGIAHELNNKLTPVLGYAELLQLETIPHIKHCAQNIGRSIEEAAHIIRQLLQLAKPESGTLVKVDLRQILVESITMLKFKLQDSGCDVSTAAPDTAVTVLGDQSQLKQVVINLVLNSLQAMEGRKTGRLDIRVETKGDHALFSVTDTGEGIPRELMGRIFDPFFTTKGPDRGTGLGLSICSSIIREHGGDISVESEPGNGAKFSLVLPLDPSSRAEATPFAATSTSRSPFKGEYVEANVLVVEDEGVLRCVLQEMLHSCFRCTVDQAQNGGEALRAIANKHYDLIVSDIRMPVMDGVELFSSLKKINPAAAKRFVFVTGYAGEKSIEQRIADWGVPVITKPFKLSRLSEVCFPFLVNATPPRQLDLIDSAPMGDVVL